jgi:hypothetical protein
VGGSRILNKLSPAYSAIKSKTSDIVAKYVLPLDARRNAIADRGIGLDMVLPELIVRLSASSIRASEHLDRPSKVVLIVDHKY